MSDNIEEIKATSASARSFWDSQAERFALRPVPSWKSDRLLRRISKYSMLSKDSTVLDIGCGAGRYSVALSSKCKKLTATDISSEMLACAEAASLKNKRTNIDFKLTDWHNLSISDIGWHNKFDLVFANMTAAIRSPEDFDKMLSAGRNWGICTAPLYRQDFVLDFLRNDVLNKPQKFDMKNTFEYAFKKLRELDLLPGIEYRRENRIDEFDTEYAFGFYISRLSMDETLSESEKREIKKAIDSLAKFGKIENAVSTLTFTLLWSKNRENILP